MDQSQALGLSAHGLQKLSTRWISVANHFPWLSVVISLFGLSAMVSCTTYHALPRDGGPADTEPGMGGQRGAMGGGSGETGLNDGASDAGDSQTVDGPARDAGGDSPADSGSSLLQLGAGCSLATACASGNCVENVCCDKPCTGLCSSCRQARTAIPDGTCGSVAVGRDDPQGRCGAAAAPSSCGVTGHCNGQGACQKYDTTTSCGGASCAASRFTPAVLCDGLGTCQTAVSRTCDPYACDQSGCKTACAGSPDCAAGNYCSGSACMPRKTVGLTCASADECLTAICGGRCCSSPCTCPRPSPENLLGSGAGFDDTDLSSWGPPGTMQWSSQDADGCPYSGSVQILSASGYPRRCVAVTAGASYSLGGYFKNADGSPWACYFFTFAGPNCPLAETPGLSGSFTGTNTAWAFQSAFFQAPAGNVSLIFYCDSSVNTFVDKLFISPAGQGF